MFLRNVSIHPQNYTVSNSESHDQKLQNMCKKEQLRRVPSLLLFNYLENCKNKKSEYIKVRFVFFETFGWKYINYG